jgi:hypothetical protein
MLSSKATPPSTRFFPSLCNNNLLLLSQHLPFPKSKPLDMKIRQQSYLCPQGKWAMQGCFALGTLLLPRAEETETPILPLVSCCAPGLK